MKQTRPLLPLLVTGMLSTAASADVLLQYDFENASPGVGVTSVAASVLPAGVVASSFAQLVGLGGIGVVNGATQQYNVNGIDTIDATNEYATFSVQFPYSTTIDSLTFDTAVNDYDPITVDVEWATNSGFTGATALGTSISVPLGFNLQSRTANTAPFLAAAGTTYYFRLRATSLPTFGTSQWMLDNVQLNGRIQRPQPVPAVSGPWTWLMGLLLSAVAWVRLARQRTGR